MSFKVCTKCKVGKPATTDFFSIKKSTKDGLCSSCKVCEKAYKRAYRSRLEVQAAEKAYKRAYEAKTKNKVARKEYNRTYRISNHGMAVHKAAKSKFPKKYKARYILQNAVACGKLIKPLRCSICYQEQLLEGHHYDYDRPLEVRWLCRHCHKELHVLINNSK
jgi:hypothetical protein